MSYLSDMYWNTENIKDKKKTDRRETLKKEETKK